MRPRFQTTAAQRYCYEAIMIVFTQLSISYSVLPFVTLHFSSAWTFYRLVCACVRARVCSPVRIRYARLCLLNSVLIVVAAAAVFTL